MKIRHYEILEGMGCYVIRQEGNWKASGLIALTCGRSKADRYAAERLIEQANHATELLEAHARMIRVLAMFLEDARFDVSVGGNPTAVERMILDAKAALAAARQIKELCQTSEGRNSGGK